MRARSAQVFDWLVERSVDVALLQETKCTDPAFPFEHLAELGYQAAHYGVDHWNGVAIISRVGIVEVRRGFATAAEFEEPRCIAATCGGVRCWSVYVPNGRSLDDPQFGHKLKWLGQLATELHAVDAAGDLSIVAGDFNVGLSDQDFYDAKRWADKKHATSEERQALQATLDLGFIDLARQQHVDTPQFTWWNYVGTQFGKDKGLRIDLALGSPRLATQVDDVWVDRRARDPLVLEPAKPSDHAPVVVDLVI